MQRSIRSVGATVAAALLCANAAAQLAATKPAKTITVTSAAAAEIAKIAREQELKGWYLQVGVKEAPERRLSYVLDLNEEAPAADDEVFEDRGIKIRVDSRSALYLIGTVVDFKEEPTGRGFVFRNPNAKPE